jgi:hypothetical protein
MDLKKRAKHIKPARNKINVSISFGLYLICLMKQYFEFLNNQEQEGQCHPPDNHYGQFV